MTGAFSPARCPLTGTRVLLNERHPRAGSFGVVLGRYMRTGGFWLLVEGGGGLRTVARESDWLVVS